MPGDTVGPRKVPPAGALASTPGGADLTERFIAALRHARMEAGDPPYRALARRVKFYSAPTIWRAFNGEKLPHWRLVEPILAALGVDHALIGTRWREMWNQARAEAVYPRRGMAQAQPVSAAPPLREVPAEGLRGLPGRTSPPGGPDLAAGLVCEDCGALIGNLVHHQAWHWRIERQLSRATLRPVEGTGQ